MVIVYPLPGGNIVTTVAQIRKVLPSVEATLPHDVHVGIAMDRSQSVNAAVRDTERTLFIAVLLVIGVVFVFLQSPRARSWIPAVALPLSIIGTFGPMYLLGYSLDNLSLMALTIGTGLRGRRCGGRSREHRAPCRIGHGPARRPPCAAAPKSASRSFR